MIEDDTEDADRSEPGDILQVRPDYPVGSPGHWCAGRLVIVDRVEPWGVVAYVPAVRSATPSRPQRVPVAAYTRLTWDMFVHTGGKARWQIGDGIGDGIGEGE